MTQSLSRKTSTPLISQNNLNRMVLPALLVLGLLRGCITFETRTPPPPVFITSTLPAGPAATPTMTSTPRGFLPRPENCTDEAVLLEDVTIPDGTLLAPGEAFTKTWRLMNIGTCPWDAGYSLIFLTGERMSAPDSVPLTITLPGESLDISVDLIAPSINGRYMGVFTIRNPLGGFLKIGSGDNIWVKILVGK